MEEVTTVTINDIMKDRDMKKGEALDGQVTFNFVTENFISFYMILIQNIDFQYSIVFENRFGGQRMKIRPDFLLRLVVQRPLLLCTKNVIQFQMLGLCR